MAYSVSIDRAPAYLRYVVLADLKHISERTREALQRNWPYTKTDFGGHVQRITLLDLLDVSRDMLLAISEIGPARADEILRAVDRGKNEHFPYRVI